MAKETFVAREGRVNPINAMRRTKSINDLNEQIARIQDNSSYERSERATNIYSRYLENIGNTEENARDRYNIDKALYNRNAKEYRRMENLMENRQYSRRQYMGR